MHMCDCVCRGQRSTAHILSITLHFTFLRKGLNSGLTDLTRMAFQWTPGSHLSLSFQCCDGQTCPHSRLPHGCCLLNSHTHAYAASTLLAWPPHQPVFGWFFGRTISFSLIWCYPHRVILLDAVCHIHAPSHLLSFFLKLT